MKRLSSEARRWLAAMCGLVIVGLGIGLTVGIGVGLSVIGSGIVLAALLYDPDRGVRA